MGLIRLFLIGLLIYVAYLWLRSQWRKIPSSKEDPTLIMPQPLAACERCGTQVPLDAAVRDQDRIYCSQACRHEFSG
ncbi:MAG: hypothetical protein HQL63_12130 [Magnetococcales bacterium]|nr:hypothetical protein [Magnetococcales bacterium]MBF0321676.1 hypothetical protein [Magnetococcales bacterium]